jgi:U3 small nucleolar RNA-associated protein 21
MWIFDSADGTARLLRSRSGHSAAPHRVRFYGDGSSILSAGQDRALRTFSIIREQQSMELSQGHLAKKAKAYHLKVDELRLPLISDFVASKLYYQCHGGIVFVTHIVVFVDLSQSAPTKEREWANIVTCHDDESAAYTWIYEQKTLGKNKLMNPAIKPAATARVILHSLSYCSHIR